MRRAAIQSAVGFVAIGLALVTVLGADASAGRRHRRDHFHRSPFCPSDYQAVDGVCVPVPTIPPPAHTVGNLTMSPDAATMTMTGSTPPVGDWSVSGIAVSGLPSSVAVTISSPALAGACSSATITLATPNDATGHLTFNASGVKCPPGSYAINFKETAAPNQTFTTFMALHF